MIINILLSIITASFHRGTFVNSYLISDELQLSRLSAFDNCTIHIISAQMNKFTNVPESAYTINLLEYPTVRSKHHFAPEGDNTDLPNFMEEHRSLQCGYLTAFLNQSKSNFIFRTSPPPKQNCIVQFYIDPPNCPSWKKRVPSLTYVHSVLSETMFDLVFDHRRKWYPSLSQSLNWRWVFVHCRKVNKTSQAKSYMDDIEQLVRRDLRGSMVFNSRHHYDEFPAAPLTLIYIITQNMTTSLGHHFISNTYIVNEIEERISFLSKLKTTPISKLLLESKDEPLPFPESQLSYNWYAIDISRHNDIDTLDKILRDIYPILTFYYAHGVPILGNARMYPTVWNQSHHGLASVILSLVFKHNVTSENIRQQLNEIRPANLRGKVTYLVADSMPRNAIMTSDFGEGYPSFAEVNVYHFLTCAPRGTTTPSLKGLISAFDGYTWLLILLATFATIVTLETARRFRGLPNSLVIFYHNLFFVTNVLLCQDAALRFVRCKIFVWCWLLIGLVISNAYQGENIGQLSSPLKYLRFEKFSQIIENNFTVYAPIELHYKKYQHYFEKQVLENWTLHSTLGDVLQMRFEIKKFQLLFNNIWFPPTDQEKLATFNDSFFLPILTRCEENVFYAEHSVVAEMFMKLRTLLANSSIRESRSLIVSQKPFYSKFFRLLFCYFPIPANLLAARMHWLADSGLIQFWSRWDLRLRKWHYNLFTAKQSSNQPRRISTKGNFSVVFMLKFGLLLLMTPPFFVLEVVLAKYKNSAGCDLCSIKLVRMSFKTVNAKSKILGWFNKVTQVFARLFLALLKCRLKQKKMNFNRTFSCKTRKLFSCKQLCAKDTFNAWLSNK